MQHRDDLASLTVEFLNLSPGLLSGATVKMSDDRCALCRTQSQELLAGKTNPPADLFQGHGRRFQAESMKLVSRFLDLAGSVRTPPFQELVTQL
jgi:hypothetical protein